MHISNIYRDNHARDTAATFPCEGEVAPGAQCMALIMHVALTPDAPAPIPLCTSCATRMAHIVTQFYTLVKHDC